jgi:hypothetical protein
MLDAYATWTGTRRNLKALRMHSWRLIMTPDVLQRNGNRRPVWDDGTPAPYALDNGAWGAFSRGEPWDEARFVDALRVCEANADWVVLPDIVAGGLRSLEKSAAWLSKITARKLLPVQDGMTSEDVLPLVGENVGLFLGGSTEWKLATMSYWGQFAKNRGLYLHVGRVNTVRRIRQCALAPSHSFDGTSCTRFAKNTPMLDAARRRFCLFTRRHEWQLVRPV